MIVLEKLHLNAPFTSKSHSPFLDNLHNRGKMKKASRLISALVCAISFSSNCPAEALTKVNASDLIKMAQGTKHESVLRDQFESKEEWSKRIEKMQLGYCANTEIPQHERNELFQYNFDGKEVLAKFKPNFVNNHPSSDNEYPAVEISSSTTKNEEIEGQTGFGAKSKFKRIEVESYGLIFANAPTQRRYQSGPLIKVIIKNIGKDTAKQIVKKAVWRVCGTTHPSKEFSPQKTGWLIEDFTYLEATVQRPIEYIEKKYYIPATVTSLQLVDPDTSEVFYDVPFEYKKNP